MQRLLNESMTLTSRANYHREAMMAHRNEQKKHEEEYLRHEDEWRKLNRQFAENCEKARALQQEQIASATREYFICNT